jgi:hypothetical protein
MGWIFCKGNLKWGLCLIHLVIHLLNVVVIEYKPDYIYSLLLSQPKWLYSLYFSHVFFVTLFLFACGLLDCLLNYLVTSLVIQAWKSSYWAADLVFYQRFPEPFVGRGHVLGLHDVSSRNNAPIIESFLRFWHSWWLSTHEWLWLKHLQNGKRQWRRCLRQVPLPRKFNPVVIFSILSLKSVLHICT